MSDTKSIQQKIGAILSNSDIRINGDRPWDPRIKNERTFERLLAQGSLGFGEAYMDGWWDCPRLDDFFYHAFRDQLNERIRRSWDLLYAGVVLRLRNLQRRSRAFEIGQRHYDLGNDLFEAMLDRRMVYTCAYWKDAATLDQAQENKLRLVCDKLDLQPGMKVLDIGCGWGSFAQFAAENYGVEVEGITVSEEQVEMGRERCKGLPVEIRLQDYRDEHGEYDRIVSLGMMEHVGYKNYKTLMKVMHRCLRDRGQILIQTIGSNRSVTSTDAWIRTYIFPNSMLPSICQIGKAIEPYFVMEDWHNFGPHYDKTLMAWHENFERHWPELEGRYSERFRRMWKFYLLSCAGSFRARYNQLWQVVLSKKGTPNGFVYIR